MELLEHTGREALRLGLGVDMATGIGWPFGGLWIDKANALQRAVLRVDKIAGEPAKMAVNRATPGGEGLVVDLYFPNTLRRDLAPFDCAFADFPALVTLGDHYKVIVVPATPRMAGGDAATPLAGKWDFTFLSGGPEIPPPRTTTTLACWTKLGGDATKRFGGTATYQLELMRPRRATLIGGSIWATCGKAHACA